MKKFCILKDIPYVDLDNIIDKYNLKCIHGCNPESKVVCLICSYSEIKREIFLKKSKVPLLSYSFLKPKYTFRDLDVLDNLEELKKTNEIILYEYKDIDKYFIDTKNC